MAADITFRTAVFPVGFRGIPYEAAIGYTGAVTAITAASVGTGSLPTGLSFSADFVRITGTPTATGIFTFTIVLTDTAGAATSGSYSISILPPYEEPFDQRTNADAIRIQWPLS